ncbi:Phospholipase C [Pseudocyphellaria aurata]|nr:Phospholipase C [Pseudocyphellaria aurata]
MAVDIPSIPAMSPEPERVFPGAKLTVSDQRNSLEGETIELLECLKSWFRLGLFTEEDLHAVVNDRRFSCSASTCLHQNILIQRKLVLIVEIYYFITPLLLFDVVLVIPQRAKSSTKELIEISEDSPTPPSKTIANVVPPSRRRGGIQIPSMPNFKIGHAEKERQSTNNRIAVRKQKAGFENFDGPIVQFNVGIAHFTFDDSHEDGGYWTALKSSFTTDEANRDLTSDELCMSLVANLRGQIKRPNLKSWISCGSADNWCLGHTDPSKMAPRDGAPWTNPKLLSKAIKDTSYERKPISGMLEKLVLIWLYYTPDAPESSLLAPPSISRNSHQDMKGKKENNGG